jgi:hypothetical protein
MRAKEQSVTTRRLILVVSAVVLIAGVIGLFMPISVPGDNGAAIGCGNAVAADQSAARAANDKGVANIPVLNQVVPHTDYVAKCESAVSGRRAWSIPVAVLGAIGVVGALAGSGRRGVAADRL